LAAAGIVDIVTRLGARASAAGVRFLAQPPLPPRRIDAIGTAIGGLPLEVADLLSVTTGFQFGSFSFKIVDSLSVRSEPLPADSPWRLFPRHLIIGSPVPAFTLIADLGMASPATAPVFAVSVRPAIITVAALSLTELLGTMARALPAKPRDGEWDYDPLARLAQLPETGRDLFRPARWLRSGPGRQGHSDKVITAYADAMPQRTRIADLRTPAIGATIVWGGKRRAELFHRHPSERIFAVTECRWHRGPLQVLLGMTPAAERQRCARLYSAR
jgi:hypothetical protein